MKKDDSIFHKDSVFRETHIWAWVYGAPFVIGLLLILMGTTPVAQGLGGLLIVGVFGSFLTISMIEYFILD